VLKTGPAIALGTAAVLLLMVELGLRLFPLAAVEVHRGSGSAAQHARFYRSDISWGHGVEQGERYSDLVGRLLAAWGIDAEVVNLAVSGYATDQETLLFRADGVRYCPDLVLLGLYENDLRENAAAVQGRYPKPYFRAAEGGELTLANSPVPRVADWGADGAAPPPREGGLTPWLRRHVRLYAAAALVKARISAPADPTPADPPASPEQVELTARLIQRLAEDVERTGSGFAVVVLPELRLAATPAVAAARSGVAHVLDLTPVFRAAGRAGPPLFHRLDGAHWTRRAHALAAVAIAEFVAIRRLLPPAPRACGAAP
jgi:hypothetical protein